MVTGRLLGISGWANTGKDAAAAALVEQGWHLGKFSGALKEAMYRTNPQIVQNHITYRYADLVDAYGIERVKEDFPESRAFMTRFGKAMREVIGEDVWIRAALAQVPDGKPAVFVDCRYRNEADAIRAAGGLVVRLERPGTAPAVSPDGSIHISETDLDDYDFDVVVHNDSSLERLRMQMDAIGDMVGR